MKIGRFLRTIAPLRREQKIAQVKKRFFPQSTRAILEVERQAEAAPSVKWSPVCAWLSPEATKILSETSSSISMTYLGEERLCGWPPNWSDTLSPKLWRYNLHYHHFLFELEYEDAKVVVSDYFNKHPLKKGAEGWEPYPVSLRLMAWLPLFYGRWAGKLDADPSFRSALWLELRRMACWLEQNLETHLMANHLFENAAALALFGACFSSADADRASALAKSLLQEQLEEQFLEDGGHFERSPMYHSRLLYCLALLLNSGDSSLVNLCSKVAVRAGRWLEKMIHADGNIALFNDAAMWIYPPPKKILNWLDQILGMNQSRFVGSELLPDSGYFTCNNDAGDSFFMDVGEIGPTYQPGHAHADFLAVELSLSGKRFIVDGGVFDYEHSAERAWCRSVEAHSTVFIKGEEPLELWGAFRVGRRGSPTDVECERAGQKHICSASHDGYAHLTGRPTPFRKTIWQNDGPLLIEDLVESVTPMQCITQLRISASWKMERRSPRRIGFTFGNIECVISASQDIEIKESEWFPSFGFRERAYLLRQVFYSGSSLEKVCWRIEKIAP